MNGIGVWLPGVVLFEDWELPKQDQYELWVMLGLLPVLIESLLLLQLRWSGGRLKVSNAITTMAAALKP